MLIRVFTTVVIMSLLTCLSSSSFFLTDYLDKKITNDNYNAGQFSYALKHDVIAALQLSVKNSDRGSERWLKLNRKLARSESHSALALALWYQNLAGTAVDKEYTFKAVMWFEQAIRLNSQQAVIELAQLYFQQDKLTQAQAVLNQLNQFEQSNNLTRHVLDNSQHKAAQILRIKMAVYLGDVDLVQEILVKEQFNLVKEEGARTLLTDIYRFGILEKQSSSISTSSSKQLDLTATACITSVQLFATNLNHLKHLERLIETFKTQQVLAQYVCLAPPRYINLRSLDCVATKNQAISCDESLWQKLADKVNTRHIGLMLKEGGANVHLGMLYFDIEDSADVFSHEISHLLGFIDEYPLVKNHSQCQKPQQRTFAHNIVVLKQQYYGSRQVVRKHVLASIPWAKHIKASTPILQAIQEGSGSNNRWQLGTPTRYKDEMGLYVAESCQDSVQVKGRNFADIFSAFKPVSKRTQLRNFTSEFPSQYLTLLNEKPTAFLMPSFHYNIALALYQQGSIEQATHWLNMAAVWEKDVVRKQRVLKGDF